MHKYAGTTVCLACNDCCSRNEREMQALKRKVKTFRGQARTRARSLPAILAKRMLIPQVPKSTVLINALVLCSYVR